MDQIVTENTNCFVYMWINKANGKKYIGSRTAKNCHQNDGYICSSKIVKPLVNKNPEQWERIILATGSKKFIRHLESFFLLFVDAAKNDNFYNKNNQSGKFVCTKHSNLTIEKIVKNHAWKGKKRPEHSKKMMGRTHGVEALVASNKARKGLKFTQSHIENLTKSFRKHKYTTPFGTFYSSRDAAKAANITKTCLLGRCKGYTARGIFYNAVDGWKMERIR